MHTLRHARAEDADRCHAIEVSAYASSAAATREKILKRIMLYPEGFLILEAEGQIAGFINSGCADQVVLSDEAFKELVGHDPDAPNVVIMSVVVDPAQQGRGLSRALMSAFVEQIRQRGKREIHLICRDHHVPLYERFGYRYVRPSASDHGGMAWHEMCMTL
ncbi:GNAT family N-acetyltransferase [Jannaschia sp. M317]|uniref:GNAT family N-acetyltransferase n=1 Tax=Jannaschia sp. M317 TaxID=2867011 RepID=UPI0021A54AA1|nr:GNAT family N-acetyltransferase [Jannaschia sp. M317]UWQ17710.1 GNAT family N-acetyltransferase [Jannaschia sp. M317]